jgi:hypothetical protein
LRGKAEEIVSILLAVDNDEEIIEILEQNFRKSDFIIQGLMVEAR